MDALRALAPTGSPLSVGSPLVWFIFVACALLQLPLIMDVCSQLFGVNRLVHNVVSKVLVVLMTVCGCLSMWMFHTIFLPHWQQATGSPLLGLTLFTTWLFLNSSYRLSRAIMTDPGDGYAAPESSGQGEQSGSSSSSSSSSSGGGSGGGGDASGAASAGATASLCTCKKCDKLKAPFAHHCGVCGRCVSYMDHHCPFTHNCVGRANFVHYYLFLLWTTMGAVLASYLSLPAFLNCVIGPSSKFSVLIGRLLRYDAAGGAGVLLAPDVTYAQNIEHCERVGDKALTFVVVALGLGCVSTLLVCHTAMLWLDLSTIDSLNILTSRGFDLLFRPWSGLPAACRDVRALPVMDKWGTLMRRDEFGDSRPLWTFFMPTG